MSTYAHKLYPFVFVSPFLSIVKYVILVEFVRKICTRYIKVFNQKNYSVLNLIKVKYCTY
jgi:hypothetical protein